VENRETVELTKEVIRDDTGLVACLTPEFLSVMGVNLQAIPALQKVAPDSCVDVAASIPAASSTFDFEKQRLDISVPQIAIMNGARGYIPPEHWDEGINALMLSYNFSGSNSSDHGEGGSATNSYFLGLHSGVNLGPWRLRDNSTFSYNSSDEGNKSQWQHSSTYVERAIIPLKGELTVGESYTPSEIFESLGFRGVQITSDDNMLPDSEKGFAPTIRGIAKSNAQLTIKQNGYVIYQTYVPPGAFEIKDLYPTSSSGDLVAELKESDGSTTNFSVPYSAVPLLQREGRMKYALTIAKYRSGSDDQKDIGFGQGTIIWGLPYGFTVFGGTQLSNNYQSAALGGGVNLGTFGAFSIDVTQADSTLADDSSYSGQSVRFLYSKSLNNFGTDFQLLGYRYSTSGFYTLDETAYKYMNGFDSQNESDDDEPDWSSYYNLYYTKRGKVQVNVSQQVTDDGSIFITGSEQSYWHTDETDSLLQLGYSGSVSTINFGLSYNYNKYAGADEADHMFAVNISLPLGQWMHPGGDITQHAHNVYATYNVNTDKHGNTTHNAGLNGTLLDDNNLSYSVQQGYGNHDVGTNGNANAQYTGEYGNSSIGYNYNDNGDYQQFNYGMSGGIVAHRNGITLSQPLSDTNVLVSVPGADGVKVENNTGVRTDWRGYTVVPYASSYRLNRIALDTNSMGDDVDIDEAVVNVVPTQGALVRANFKAHVGERALASLTFNNKPVPFGALVTRSDQAGESIVGDDGQVYLSGLTPKGQLSVQWGKGADTHCVVHYKLNSFSKKNAVNKFSGTCV
jgi:outer membrane usher protein